MFCLRRILVASFCCCFSFASAALAADPPAATSLPTIVLIGDSIRMGYDNDVAEMLKGKANVVFAEKENGGDSNRVLTNLDRWIIEHKPTVVHFNCGLHDLKVSRTTKTAQVPIEEYEQNLRTIVDRLQKDTKARLIFATTTPIHDERHAKRKGGMDRYEADVQRYNRVARKVMEEKGVEIDDLHAVVTKAGLENVQKPDGTHYTPAGSKVLAEAVVKSVTSEKSKTNQYSSVLQGTNGQAFEDRADYNGAMLSPELQKRLFKLIYEAERDPSADLSIAAMAERAGLSPYYFQRAFRSLTGESTKQYVLRLRLQRAAFILKRSSASVLQIALDAGFETHAGFTKAFARVYGKSPTAFREEAGTVPYISSLSDGHPLEDAAALSASQLIVRFEQWPKLTIAAKRYVGNTLGMAGLWPTMVKWARRRELLNDQTLCFGIHYDDWDPQIEHKYRYDAAIVVPDGFEDGEITITTIPAGQIALLEFEGSLRSLDRAWWRFVNEWLPVSGYQVRTTFVFDRYPAADIASSRLKQIVKTLTGIRATLCIPIEKSPATAL